MAVILPPAVLLCLAGGWPRRKRRRKRNCNTCFGRGKEHLERYSCPKLDLASGAGGFGDGAGLGRIDEAVRRPQIAVIEGVEELSAELELHPLGQAEVAGQSKVE